jgi:hypothetical protein
MTTASTIITTNRNVYKTWNRLFHALTKHVAANEFNLLWFEEENFLGFKCNKTGDAFWNPLSWLLGPLSIVMLVVPSARLRTAKGLPRRMDFVDGATTNIRADYIHLTV